MDFCDLLPVRFHFNGKFVRNSDRVFYDGGTEAMSYIDRDKMSLPEVVGHLRDHYNVKEGTMLHWLFPGRDMITGLRALFDDNVCQLMSDNTPEDGVADVFAENAEHDATEEASEYEDDMEDNSEDAEIDDDIEDEDLHSLGIVRKIESKEEIDKQLAVVRQFYNSPNKRKEQAEPSGETEPSGDEKSDTDSEYMPGDSNSSGDDEEADQIFRRFKDFKKKVKRGQATSLDDVVYEGVACRPPIGDDEDDGNCTPYVDSSDAESVDDLAGVGQGSMYPRFDKKHPVMKFKLGMKFSSKKQFKKAVLKHALAEKKVILFAKNDPERVRAKCDWKGRPKTERRREPTEGRKATKMPKSGTVIRCSKCHLPGHNKTTCTNISSAGPSQSARSTHAAFNSEGRGTSQPTQSQSAVGGNPNAIVVLSNTQKSSTSGTKRSCTSDRSNTITSKQARTSKSKNIIKSSAHARVSTLPTGSATLTLQARVPTPNVNSSVHVQLSGGTASVHVSAQEPAKSKPTQQRTATTPLLMLGPWQSHKL